MNGGTRRPGPAGTVATGGEDWAKGTRSRPRARELPLQKLLCRSDLDRNSPGPRQLRGPESENVWGKGGGSQPGPARARGTPGGVCRCAWWPLGPPREGAAQASSGQRPGCCSASCCTQGRAHDRDRSGPHVRSVRSAEEQKAWSGRGQGCRALPLVAQAGPRLLAGMPAPPPGRTWCSGQRPEDEPPTDQVGRGPLRCRASLMEAKRRGEPEGSSPVPPGDSGDEGALGVPGAEGASCPLGAMASPWTQESRVQRGRRRAVGTAAPPGPAPQQAGGPGAERSGWPKRAERPGSHRLAGHSGVHTPAHQRRGRESNL